MGEEAGRADGEPALGFAVSTMFNPDDRPLLSNNESGLAPSLQALLEPLRELLAEFADPVPADRHASLEDDATEPSELPDIAPDLLNMASTYADAALAGVPSVLRGHLSELRIDSLGFRSRLRHRWGRALRWLEYLGHLAFEVGAEAAATRRPGLRGDEYQKVMTHLHARGCQVFREVVLLLRNGYADGANARWRTLHELAVTALFIQQHGDDTAKRFLEHAQVENHKAALEYAKWQQRLGVEPLDQEMIREFETERDRLLAQYGNVFDTPHGWAAGALNRNDRFSIEALEVAIDLSHLRPYYRQASYGVHAAPKAALFCLGNPDPESPFHLAGASNAGLADPGQSAAISMVQLTIPLLTDEPTLESLTTAKLLDRVMNRAIHEFLTAHEQLEAENGGEVEG